MNTTTFRIVRDRMETLGATMGMMFLGDGPALCTLELPWKGNAEDVSCIPNGTYGVILARSPKFGPNIPHVLDVPGRTDILIHPGNTVADITGCICPGLARTHDSVRHSAAALAILVRWLQSALMDGGVLLDISYAEAA